MVRNNVYANEDEKFVKTVIVYANSAKKLFHDEAAKDVAVSAEEVKDLFLKGMTVVYNSKHLAPIALSGSSIVCNDGSSAVTFTTA